MRQYCTLEEYMENVKLYFTLGDTVKEELIDDEPSVVHRNSAGCMLSCWMSVSGEYREF